MLAKKIHVFLFFILLTGCTQLQVFEKNINIPNYKWYNNNPLKGSFDIKDTISTYNIYLVIRHLDLYNYNNIWLNIGFQPPSDSIFNEKKEISLANDATGWYGIGMGDIWEMKNKLNAVPRRFKKTGTYHFTISQMMRENPLPYIMSVGLRVEKVEY